MKDLNDFELKKANVVSIYGGYTEAIPTQTLWSDGRATPNDGDDTGDIG